ncbi:DUF2637 domain-containing protein [Streptomyces sp. t39]|uniref:DUF2637 domain-containing protein n=1 Tax=Streptomyces sp. t39 TaxID=1828156 RepID=UPI0021C8C0FF|nr:DUF2637 domain-containing protein [Streptomyces sp. t39]
MTRKLRVDAVLVQALIAGALSFSHLHDLAEAAGQTGWKAWAYPVSVDLLLVAAWRRMSKHADNGAAWLWFTIALAASLGANIATAGLLDLSDVPDWLRILVAGWPALAFLGGTLLAHAPTPHADPEPRAVLDREPVTADAPTAPEPATATEPGQGGDDPVPSLLLVLVGKQGEFGDFVDRRAATSSSVTSGGRRKPVARARSQSDSSDSVTGRISTLIPSR